MRLIFLAFFASLVISGCSTAGIEENENASMDSNKNAMDMQSSPNEEQAQSSAISPNLDPIYFAFDSYIISSNEQYKIQQEANWLLADPSRRAVMEGHADERGGREYNIALGQKRSENVLRALVLLGVQKNQLEAISFGKENPVDLGHNEEAWSKNRRVEIVHK